MWKKRKKKPIRIDVQSVWIIERQAGDVGFRPLSNVKNVGVLKWVIIIIYFVLWKVIIKPIQRSFPKVDLYISIPKSFSISNVFDCFDFVFVCLLIFCFRFEMERGKKPNNNVSYLVKRRDPGGYVLYWSFVSFSYQIIHVVLCSNFSHHIYNYSLFCLLKRMIQFSN